MGKDKKANSEKKVIIYCRESRDDYRRKLRKDRNTKRLTNKIL